MNAPISAMNDDKRQFEWDGTESLVDVFSYSHSLGPRDVLADPAQRILPLSIDDVRGMIDIFRERMNSDILPKPVRDTVDLRAIRISLEARIDALLLENSDTFKKWFLKTNRHSCKDAVLDHPTEEDLKCFEQDLLKYPSPPLDQALDDVDFSPAFVSMCRSRIKSTAVSSGYEAISLLSRSRRIYEDFELQLRLDANGDCDFYLCFSPFNELMAEHPTHEFRCYVSGRKLRCIAQYSYLVQCPIPAEHMSDAAIAMADTIYNNVLPRLPESIIDAAIDLQCVLSPPLGDRKIDFDVIIIEVNPLGPGTVWGTLDWAYDSPWLLGKEELPQSCIRRNNLGEETTREQTKFQVRNKVLGDELNHVSYEKISVNCVLSFISSKTCLGLTHSAIAHIPADYMLILWSIWQLDLRPVSSALKSNETNSLNEEVTMSEKPTSAQSSTMSIMEQLCAIQ